MCEFCKRFGEGAKWYLNPKNYGDEVLKSERFLRNMRDILGFVDGTIIEVLSGPQRQTFEEMSAAMVDTFLPDIRDEEAKKALNEMLENSHGGQVVPIEDAMKIIDTAREPIMVQECYCRKYFGGGSKFACIWFYPTSVEAPEKRPWEEHRMLTREEAKELLEELDKEGCYHAIYWAPIPYPICICNCDPLYCISFKARMAYGIRNAVVKGEYVAVVDAERCNGCKKCMTRCNFGAIRYSPMDSRVYVDVWKCFGCGLCRRACSEDAIELVEREKIPPLREEY